MYLKHHLSNLAKIFEDKEWTGAVNLLLVEDTLAMIVRSYSVSTHKGQIALLGGHRDGNDNTPVETAAREFEEETMLSSEDIRYHSYLPPVRTGGGNLIIPVVGEYLKSKEYFLSNAKSNGEWDNLLLVDLSYLANWKNWQKASTNYSTGHLYFVPVKSKSYIGPGTKDYYTLWGATAKMLWYFFKFQ